MPEIQKKIELLQKIAHRFNEANIEWALGASMLLYFKGILSEFHDIDSVSYTHLRAHETDSYLVCRLLLGKAG